MTTFVSNDRIALIFTFVVLAALLLPGVAHCDSITAEEIEVPPPEWSVFFEPEPDPPTPGPLVDFTPQPEEITTESEGGTSYETPTGPPIIVGVPPCWLIGCGGDGGDNGRRRQGRSTPPSVPEPGAALLFAGGLLLLRSRR